MNYFMLGLCIHSNAKYMLSKGQGIDHMCTDLRLIDGVKHQDNILIISTVMWDNCIYAYVYTYT